MHRFPNCHFAIQGSCDSGKLCVRVRLFTWVSTPGSILALLGCGVVYNGANGVQSLSIAKSTFE